MDKGAGVDLLKKVGDEVAKGEPLYRLHAEFKGDYRFALDLIKENGSGYTLGETSELPQAFVEF